MKIRMNQLTLDVIKYNVDPEDKYPSLDSNGQCNWQYFGYQVEVDQSIPPAQAKLGNITIELNRHMDVFKTLDTLVHTHEKFNCHIDEVQTLTIPEHVAVHGHGMKIKNSKAFGERYRATGRTFRTLCEVMQTASSSKPGNVTFLVVGHGVQNAKWCYSALNRLLHSYFGNSVEYEPGYRRIVLPESRVIRVITTEEANSPETFQGRQCKIIHDHTA